MKYAWIKKHQGEFTIAAMCRFLKLSTSSYYAWLKRPITKRDKENDELREKIKALFEASRGTYGTRRLKAALAKQGFTVSRRRTGRLMKQAGLACKTRRRFKATTDSKHNDPIAPNRLARQFKVEQPDRYYVGDITYVWTNEGWLYLAVVIDLFSRQVVGWSIQRHMRAELVNDALKMALWKRKPGKGLILHTDRGSQYASDSHRLLLRQHSIIQSMSRKGDCWDNAVAESFFHSLKTELVHHFQFKTREEAKRAIFDYIEVFYNRQRLHSTNNYLSPVDYERFKKAA